MVRTLDSENDRLTDIKTPVDSAEMRKINNNRVKSPTNVLWSDGETYIGGRRLLRNGGRNRRNGWRDTNDGGHNVTRRAGVRNEKRPTTHRQSFPGGGTTLTACAVFRPPGKPSIGAPSCSSGTFERRRRHP